MLLGPDIATDPEDMLNEPVNPIPVVPLESIPPQETILSAIYYIVLNVVFTVHPAEEAEAKSCADDADKDIENCKLLVDPISGVARSVNLYVPAPHTDMMLPARKFEPDDT
jgi:hypothetical protein